MKNYIKNLSWRGYAAAVLIAFCFNSLMASQTVLQPMTMSDAQRAQLLTEKTVELCDAIRWRIDFEQHRIRAMVDSSGQNSYDIWPEDTDVNQVIEPDDIMNQFNAGPISDETIALLDSASRGLRNLDDISFIHFIWEWPVNILQLLFPNDCTDVSPYTNPCEAAVNWGSVATFWEDTTTFDIFIVIPAIHQLLGFPWQTNLEMKDHKILIGLFRPIIGIPGFGARALIWKKIEFSVIAGFDIIGGTEAQGGALEIEEPPLLNLSVFIWNRFSEGIATSGQGGGVFATTGSFNVFIANNIENNSAVDSAEGRGGGFYSDALSINVLIANNIDNNFAAKRGGGATFNAASANFMLANRFKGNSAPRGGGIYFEEMTPIVAVKNRYVDNEATDGPGGGMYDNGGIRIAHRYEKFSGNSATTVSGGYHRHQPNIGSEEYELDDWKFSDNSAPRGGAVYIEPEFRDVDIDGCEFDGNSADIEGGAVWVPGNQDDVDFRNSHFLANHAPRGSAIYYVKEPDIDSDVHLIACRFGANYVTSDHGGACYFPTEGGPLEVFVTRTIFDAINQTPFNGGGLYTTGPQTRLFIDDSWFENNVATRSGAVWADHILEFRINGSRFDQNFAQEGGGAIWYGDGDYDHFTIRTSSFNANETPVNGGGLWITDGSNIDIQDSRFSSNRADSGAGIALNDTLTKIILFHDTLSGNIAESVGGGLYVAPGTDVDTLDGCVFSGNIANGVSAVADIDNGLGGGIYIHSETYDEDILRCKFVGNDAKWGGGIALDTFRVPFQILGCSFISNGASKGLPDDGAGGGIFINGPNLDIIIGTPAVEDSNYFERNYSEAGGGIAVYGGASPIIQNNNFQKNRADRNGDGKGIGGGILTNGLNSDPWIGGNAVLNQDNTFAYNVAGTANASRQGRGGAMGIRRGSSPLIEGNHLYFNGATYSGAGIADSSNIPDTTTIGGKNDDEIILSMDIPVPFNNLQFGNRIFNDCTVPIPDPGPPDPPDETPVEDTIFVCCCYRTLGGDGNGPSFGIPFPPTGGWVPDSTFRFPVPPEQEFLECSPLIELTQGMLDDAMAAVEDMDTLDWPEQWNSTDAFCFEWPSDVPMWPDSAWFPDTSWIEDTTALDSGAFTTFVENDLFRRWQRGDYPRRPRGNLDDDYFPDGLGLELNPCDIQGPFVPLFGGGVSVEGVANPVIFGNLIDHNCADSIGGGVWIDETTTEARLGIADTLSDSLTTDHKNFIQRNAAPRGGGVGIANNAWAPVFNNIVGGEVDTLGNLACTRGGGFYITEGAYPEIGDTTRPRNNRVQHNKVYHYLGGGFCIDSSAHPDIQGNKILNNRAAEWDPWEEVAPDIGDGGGIGIDSTNPLIHYNWILDNYSADEGGGIYSHRSWGVIDHNTIALNDAWNHGAGIGFSKDGLRPEFTNNNVVQYGPWESSAIYSSDGYLPPVFHHNNVFSRFGYDYYNIEPEPLGISGNISIPPRFYDEEKYDFRLASNSQLLTLGSPGSIGWNYPLSGTFNSDVDTFYVPNGGMIQDAIDSAEFGDFVLVDSGMYMGNFVLKNGVAVHGIYGPDSTMIKAMDTTMAIFVGDSLHHITSVSGFKMHYGTSGVELTGDARPYLFSLVIDTCDSGIVQRDTAVAWIQNNSFHMTPVGILFHDTLQVISHNIFHSTVGQSMVMPLLLPVEETPDTFMVNIRENDFASAAPAKVDMRYNVTGDPGFVAATECDYHLLCTSPCRPEVTRDSTLIGALDVEDGYEAIGGDLEYGEPNVGRTLTYTLVNGLDFPRTLYVSFNDSLGWGLYPVSDTFLVAAFDTVFPTVEVAISGFATVGTRDTVWMHTFTPFAGPCDKDSVRGFVEVTNPPALTSAELTIAVEGNDIVLRWNAYGPPGCEYAVYTTNGTPESATLIGRTRQTQYVDVNAPSLYSKRIYYVTVVNDESLRTTTIPESKTRAMK